MPIDEPKDELWTLAKASNYKPEWPGTNEDLVDKLSTAWLQGAIAFQNLGKSNFADIANSWKDVPGADYRDKATKAKDNVGRSASSMTELGELANDLATATRTVKNRIVQLVRDNSGILRSYDILDEPTKSTYRENLVNSIASQAATALTTAASGLTTGVTVEDKAALSHPPLVEIPTDRPKDANQWWNDLTDEQRSWLLIHRTTDIGNLPGLSADVRDDANQTSLRRALNSTDPTVLDNARQAQTALDQAKAHNPGVPVRLYAFDPNAFGKDGKAAVAIGDVDHAKDVAIITPGILTPGREIESLTHSATNVYQTASQNDPSRSQAVVAWIGYDTPTDSDVGNTAGPGGTLRGGHLLAQEVAGLRAAHVGDRAHLTAIGHSYGSSTTGIAASRYGLDADDIVLVGSPGAGNGNLTAADLHHPGHVYVGSGSGDPVTHVAENTGGIAHGADPASESFGGTRFQAESPKTLFAEHSSYFDKDSESLRNIGKIVSNHANDITHAPARPVQHDPTGEPEHHRQPTLQPTGGY